MGWETIENVKPKYSKASVPVEGRFALDFAAFTLDRVEAIRPENGQPPMFTFRASAQMLAADAE